MSENNKRAPQVLQDKLAESIKALEEFAREEWPLREQEEDLPPPEWMVKDTSSVDHTAYLKVRPAITESPDSPEKMDQDVGVDSNAAAGSPEGTENATEAATEDGDESRTSEDDTLTNAIDEEGISHEGGPRPAVPNAGTAANYVIYLRWTCNNFGVSLDGDHPMIGLILKGLNKLNVDWFGGGIRTKFLFDSTTCQAVPVLHGCTDGGNGFGHSVAHSTS